MKYYFQIHCKLLELPSIPDQRDRSGEKGDNESETIAGDNDSEGDTQDSDR